MKVIHVVGSLDISAGGPSRSVPQTCEYLSNEGVDVELIARPSKNPVEVNTSANFKVRFKSIFSLIFYGFSLSKNNVDLIHLQHVWDPYIHVMAFAARVKGIPYIITPRGMLEPWIMNHNSWKKKLGMFLYQKKDLKLADCIHVTCNLEKSNVKRLGFDNRSYTIPNGIDLSLIPEPKEKYKSNKIVFLSRIHQKKGIELLLDAWVKIGEQNWTIEIAGDGEPDYIESINQKIINENIKNIKLVGSKYGDAKWDFMKSGDVFILPTYSENFGIVVAEALVVGVPVITTKGTPWEELKTHNCGWWIDLSVDNLKITLEQAMASTKQELEEMGRRGQVVIQEKYDIKNVAINIVEMYKNVMK